jgi:hypothetical protein
MRSLLIAGGLPPKKGDYEWMKDLLTAQKIVRLPLMIFLRGMNSTQ